MSGSSGYVPNPDDLTQPTSSIPASTAAAEFRALKLKIANLQSLVATWNASDKAANIVLSNANLLALQNDSAVAVMEAVRCTVGKNTGTFYYENTIGNAAGIISVGAACLDEDVEATSGIYLGQTAFSIGYQSDGKIYNNGALVGTYATYTTGDIIGVVFAAASGNVSFYKNNTLIASTAWQASVATRAKYPAIALSTYGDYLLTNFGATNFNYAIPAGASAVYASATNLVQSGRQNILINSSAMVDVRNNHAAIVNIASGAFHCDRWRYFASVANKCNAQSAYLAAVDAANCEGILNVHKYTLNGAYSPGAAEGFYFGQKIEGLGRWNRMGYQNGAASPKSATLLFYARMSKAGTYSGALVNTTGNVSYPFSFTVAAANTLQKFAIQINPCTAAVTWNTQNVEACDLRFNIGSGSSLVGAADGTWQTGQFNGVSGQSLMALGTGGDTYEIIGPEIRPGIWSSGSIPEIPGYEEEKLACGRYYDTFSYQLDGYGAAGQIVGQTLFLPIRPRDFPSNLPNASVTISGNAYVNAGTGTVQFIGTSVQYHAAIRVFCIVTALGAFQHTATITVDAEL